MRHLFAILIASTVCAGAAWAQSPVPAAPPTSLMVESSPVRLTAHVNRLTAGLGETVVLTVDVAYPSDVEVQLPAADSLDFSPFEVRDAVMTPQPAVDGRKVARYTVRLAGYEPGKQTLRPLEVSYKLPDDATKIAASNPIEITVERAASVAPPASAHAPGAPGASGAPPKPADIRDIKAMDEIPTPAWVYAAIGGAALVVLAALGLAGRAMMRRLRRKTVVPTTPHGVALAALDQLVAENLPSQGRLKIHYDRLAEILRTYLSQRFDLPALEHTTAELMALMRGGAYDDALRADVRHVLDEADMVKFARLQVPVEKAFVGVHTVRSIVERTVPAPVQAADGKPAAELAQPGAVVQAVAPVAAPVLPTWQGPGTRREEG